VLALNFQPQGNIYLSYHHKVYMYFHRGLL
jgi:hypothetical protein